MTLPTFLTDAQFWLIMLPLMGAAFMLGILLRVSRTPQQAGPSGLGVLLGQGSDQALDLMEGTVGDMQPESFHAYLALAGLYRNRGEFDRATRIHETLAKRPDATAELRLKAQLGLGRDLAAAGVMDRAEATFRQVMDATSKSAPEYGEALTHLARLLERQQRWADALQVRQLLERTHQHDPAAYGHLLLKIGEQAQASGDPTSAVKAFEEATQVHPGCTPAWQHLVRLDLTAQNAARACSRLEKAQEGRPDLFHLLLDDMQNAFDAAGDPKGLEVLWQKAAAHPRAHWQIAASLSHWLLSKNRKDEALAQLEEAYRANPKIIESATALSQLLRDLGHADDALNVLHSHLQEKQKTFMAYQCQTCGYSNRYLFWHCPQCQTWDNISPLSLTRKAS